MSRLVVAALALVCVGGCSSETPSRGDSRARGVSTGAPGESTGAPAVITLRHGEPGVRPFWNVHSGRFIYPPAFDVTDSTGSAVSILVEGESGGTTLVAPIDRPWSSVAPVWRALPPGFVKLTYRGVDASGDTTTLRVIETIRSPGFESVVGSPPVVSAESRRAAGMAGLEAVLALDKVQHWLDPGGPYPGYPLWVHPSKVMAFLSQGMLFLSRETDDPAVADQARRVSVAVAEFLLALRDPADAPLGGWVWSFWDGVDPGEHPINMNQLMTQYPAEAAMAFLDLFDETQDERWWNAALATADRYRATQRPDGTWYLLLKRDTGAPANEKLLIPGSVIVLLDRLEHQYGVDRFRDVRRAAFGWILENPAKTFAWDAQFEDTRPRSRFRNLAHLEPTILARMLFDEAVRTGTGEHLDLARELLLFVEDQFVVWSHDDAVTRTEWFRAGMKWNGTTLDGGKDWFLPAGLEQYVFYTPIARTTANVINAYCAGYRATGDVDFRDRAHALYGSLMDAQAFHGGGEIPTHLRRTLPEESWLNNSVEAARTLVAGC